MFNIWRASFLLAALWVGAVATAQTGQWQRMSYHHPASRTDLTVLPFQGRIWVTGGYDSYPSAHGDLWRSIDGARWTEAFDEAPWGRRFGHTLTEFDGQLWLIGGADLDRIPKSIWKSRDGLEWTEILAGDLPAFVDHAAVAFQDKLWILGGLHNWSRQNWVWNTADGEVWTHVTESDPAPWTGRSSHECVVYNGRLYLIGGYTPEGAANDVWYTDDGLHWTQLTPAAPWPARWGHTVTVYNNEMWLIGGYGADGALNDVWRSTDGVVWTAMSDAQIPWPPRSGHGAYVHGDALWIIGGYPNDSWHYSPLDGWREAPLTPPPMWEPRVYHDALAFDGRLWIFGGSRTGYTCGAVYASDNGRYWTELHPQSDVPMFPRSGHTVDAHDNAMWVLGGEGGVGDVWWSTDGVYWQMAVEHAPWGARSGHASIRFQDKLWIFGGMAHDGLADDVTNDVWWSYDGYTWNEEAAAPWPRRTEPEVVVFDGKLWLFGGRAGEELFGDVWTSEDGVDWIEATASEVVPWDSLVGHSVAVHDGMMWVIGGAHDGTMVMDNQVWMSRDGIKWHDYDRFADVPWNPRAYQDVVVFNDDLYVIGGFVADPVSVQSNEVWSVHSAPPMPLSSTGSLVALAGLLSVIGTALLRRRLGQSR